MHSVVQKSIAAAAISNSNRAGISAAMATFSSSSFSSSTHSRLLLHFPSFSNTKISNVVLQRMAGKLPSAAATTAAVFRQQRRLFHLSGQHTTSTSSSSSSNRITLYKIIISGGRQQQQHYCLLLPSSSLTTTSQHLFSTSSSALNSNNNHHNNNNNTHTDTSAIPFTFPPAQKSQLKFDDHKTIAAKMDRAPSLQKQSLLLELYRPEPSVPMTRCHALLRENGLNKGMAFSPEERLYLGLEGLMPSVCHTQDEQAEFEINHLREQPSPLARFRYLEALKERNEKLFYRVMRDYPAELLPIVYTPTVGDACLQFEYRYAKALFISIDKDNSVGRIHQLLCNWKQQEVRAIVVTDGERILGLGDLGVQGVEIPVGKLALYVALGGVQPSWCLPIQLDVGTDNEKFLTNPNYAGLRHKRVRGAEYERFIDNFMKACRKKYGQHVLIQFEDFGKNTAYDLLKRYQDHYCTFNDDIQGTASVSMAGLIAATRITGQKVSDMRILFHGAGTAAIGVANLIVEQMLQEGLSRAEACARIFMVKTDGLMIKKRTNLSEQQKPFAKDGPDLKDLFEVVKAVKPTAIIGVSTIYGAFTPQIIQAMASFNKRPLIFALSNPTSKSECTAEEAYKGTNGTALFASGSPFPCVNMPDGRTFQPGQCNNAYIFPGVALGVLLFKVANIPDKLFLIAAMKLAESVTKEELAVGCLYPALEKVPEISIKIAVAIGEHCYKDGSAKLYPEPVDKELFVRSQVYHTDYEQMLPVPSMAKSAT